MVWCHYLGVGMIGLGSALICSPPINTAILMLQYHSSLPLKTWAWLWTGSFALMGAGAVIGFFGGELLGGW